MFIINFMVDIAKGILCNIIVNHLNNMMTNMKDR